MPFVDCHPNDYEDTRKYSFRELASLDDCEPINLKFCARCGSLWPERNMRQLTASREKRACLRVSFDYDEGGKESYEDWKPRASKDSGLRHEDYVQTGSVWMCRYCDRSQMENYLQ